MNPEQKVLVQNSFQKVAPIADTAAELFYNRLFELDPALKPLFKNDIKEQGRKLMKMIGMAVAGLDELGVTDCTLVGHSLGGAVAAAVAERSSAVHSLALIAPVGFGPIRLAEAFTLPVVSRASANTGTTERSSTAVKKSADSMTRSCPGLTAAMIWAAGIRTA